MIITTLSRNTSMFSAIFTKGINTCVWLFFFQEGKALLKIGSTHEEFAPGCGGRDGGGDGGIL